MCGRTSISRDTSRQLLTPHLRLETSAVSVRLHHGGTQGAKPKAEVIVNILADIKDRKA